MSLEDVLNMEARNQAIAARTPDRAEGVAAFLEKRPAWSRDNTSSHLEPAEALDCLERMRPFIRAEVYRAARDDLTTG
jgi:hypothetical protein